MPRNLNQHAFLYSGANMLDLGVLPGGAYSSAWGINAGGVVVGAATPAGTSATHAFLYSSGTMTDLGTLGGAMSTAMGINDSGQVTGDAQTVSGSFHPFVYAGGLNARPRNSWRFERFWDGNQRQWADSGIR
ncbi:MAG: hypothetical protein E6H48_16395 [Betaproteobacteria bacterium]|nr:MAG: hypothetical protein E6H48_16395 [Betaproteobacteria bacterium]